MTAPGEKPRDLDPVPGGSKTDTKHNLEVLSSYHQTLSEAAYDYALSGFRVVPVHSGKGGRCSCGNPDCSSPGKHPRTPHGVKDASSDLPQVRDWWAQWPDANIGLATGDFLMVVDIDPRNGGSLEALEQLGPLPETMKARTGGGGAHLYYTSPAPVKNSAGILATGTDVKGEGGLIIAPPSIHASGEAYTWEHEGPPVPAPGWLLDRLKRPQPQPVPLGPLEAVTVGRRNDFLFSEGGKMRRRLGYSQEVISGVLLALNQVRCNPPLDGAEVARIAESAARYDAPVHSPSFLLTRISEIETSPPSWLIRDFLERDSLAQVFGEPGCGKSFLAVDVACACAAGRPFHGRKVAVAAPVVYIAGEGRAGLKRRFEAWAQHHRVSLGDLPIFLSGGPAQLCDPGSVAQVIEAVETAAANGPPALIILDTLARNSGGDENSTSEMGDFIAACDRLRSLHGAAVLLIHHSGHLNKTRARGASAIFGALDSAFRLDMDPEGVIRLTCTKMKDHEHPPPLAFRIKSECLDMDDNGEPVFSAVLADTDYEPSSSSGPGKWHGLAQGVYEDLIFKRKRTLEASGHDPGTARVTVASWKEACFKQGIPRQRFYEVQSTLSVIGLQVDHGFIRSV